VEILLNFLRSLIISDSRRSMTELHCIRLDPVTDQ
jgi:hypothetical protein